MGKALQQRLERLNRMKPICPECGARLHCSHCGGSEKNFTAELLEMRKKMQRLLLGEEPETHTAP
jgi:tRNA(Ile2) C34 agmatinyltransferase TiaS